MFTFSGGDVTIEVAGASNPMAQAAGEAFASSVDSVSSASMDATNSSLPDMADQGLGIA